MSEVLIKAENVSKKFCLSLKRSLWYGVNDIASALNPFNRGKKPSGQETGESMPPLRQGEFWAVQNLSFELKRGECLGLLGHNGAGKSTTLKILNNLVPPDTGRITMRGRVAAIIELNAGFNPILSGRENIYNQAALLGFSKEETAAKFDRIVEFSEIGDFIDMPVQNYSSGMRVRLGFSIAAQMEPDVLLIDEVLAVGDVAFRFKCLNRIGELIKNCAVIFVSHSIPQIHRICTHVITLSKGKTIFAGTDIAAGVDHYYAQMPAPPKKSSLGVLGLRSFSVSSGSERVAEEGIFAVSHGEEIGIEFEFDSPDLTDGLAVQFLFWNQEMLPVLELLTPDRKMFLVHTTPGGKSCVNVTVPAVHLNGGRYTMEIVLHSHDLSRRLARFNAPVELLVRSFCVSGASVIEAGEWRHANESPAEGAV